MRNPDFAYAKTKTQISFAVTAKLISAFVFAIRIVQILFYLNRKFQASSHLLWLYSPVCVGPGRKPRRPVFSQRGSNTRCQVSVFKTNDPLVVVIAASIVPLGGPKKYPHTSCIVQSIFYMISRNILRKQKILQVTTYIF